MAPVLDAKQTWITRADVENAILERLRDTPFPLVKIDKETGFRSVTYPGDEGYAPAAQQAVVGPTRVGWAIDDQNRREQQRFVKRQWTFALYLEFNQLVELGVWEQSIGLNPIRVKCSTGECWTLRPANGTIVSPVEQQGPGTAATYNFEALPREGLKRQI